MKEIKFNKKTVFIAAAIIAVVLYLFLPCVKIMGKASATGANLAFDLGNFIGWLFILIPLAAAGLELKMQQYAKYAAWAMFIPPIFIFTKQGMSPLVGVYVYMVLAALMSALPYIKQIPEE